MQRRSKFSTLKIANTINQLTIHLNIAYYISLFVFYMSYCSVDKPIFPFEHWTIYPSYQNKIKFLCTWIQRSRQRCLGFYNCRPPWICECRAALLLGDGILDQRHHHRWGDSPWINHSHALCIPGYSEKWWQWTVSWLRGMLSTLYVLNCNVTQILIMHIHFSYSEIKPN